MADPSVLRKRLETVWAAMRDRGIDALVVAGRGVIAQYGYLEYLVGFCPVVRQGYAVVVPGCEPVVIMANRSDAHFAKMASGFSDVRFTGSGDVIGDRDSMPTHLTSCLTELGQDRGQIGIVGLGNIMTAGDHVALRNALPEAQFSDATALLGEVKAVKDADECAEVIAAGAVADAGLQAFIDSAAAGRTGWELYSEMERAVRAKGAREVLVFVGTGPYFLHRPDPNPLVEGDLVTAYLESTGPNGYWVEKAGLFAVGAVDGRRAAFADAAYAALDAAERTMRPGASAADVAHAIEAETKAVDSHPGIWHGHGVGVDHDTPVITTGDQTPIVEGMSISVHPNLTDLDETVGASVAETFVVRSNGASSISQIPRGLHTIDRQERP